MINSKKPAHYYCELCDAKMIPGSVLDHLYGFRHRQSFFVSISLFESCQVDCDLEKKKLFAIC